MHEGAVQGILSHSTRCSSSGGSSSRTAADCSHSDQRPCCCLLSSTSSSCSGWHGVGWSRHQGSSAGSTAAVPCRVGHRKVSGAAWVCTLCVLCRLNAADDCGCMRCRVQHEPCSLSQHAVTLHTHTTPGPLCDTISAISECNAHCFACGMSCACRGDRAQLAVMAATSGLYRPELLARITARLSEAGPCSELEGCSMRLGERVTVGRHHRTGCIE